MAITNIPRSFQFFNAVAATPPDFNLDAGNYGLTIATLTGTSIQLQRLMPDGNGNLYAPIFTAITAAGYTFLQLPAGQYRVVLTAVTVFTALLEKIDVGRR